LQHGAASPVCLLLLLPMPLPPATAGISEFLYLWHWQRQKIVSLVSHKALCAPHPLSPAAFAIWVEFLLISPAANTDKAFITLSPRPPLFALFFGGLPFF